MKSGPFIRAGVMVTLLFLGVSGAFGQKIRGVAFTRSVDLPEDYIQIKTLGKADAIMMTPPRVHHMTRKADNVSVEMFSPLDLWRVPQRLGHWASPGVSFRMARVVTAPPDVEGNKRNLIHLREDCDKMLAALGAVDFDQPQALAAWAAAFTDAEPSGEFRSLPDTIKLHRIRLGALTRSDAVIITAFFSVKPGMHGADPDRMYAAFLELEEGTPVADAQALLEKSFLPSVATLSGAPVRSSPGSASRRGTAGPATRVESPERIRSREVVLQTIRGLPRWWVSESDRYIIVSDLSGNSKSFVERLNGNLNELLKVYESIIPPVKPIEAVSAVRVFAESTDYLQYVGPGYEWSGGMWNPSRVELIIRVSGWQQGSERKASLAGTIQHEALHQYLFYAFPGIQTAAWYNEGHAQ
ncbi:MAG: hypothetical protein U1E27_10870, partial [Kiritimatiellia bacterium]|nr:hypothetical protein [Kiritimatiellia bacterium]